MARRADRTLFNTELMPWLDEDTIESNDPQEVERRCYGSINNVVREDRERFNRLCKKYGWDNKSITSEHKQKHSDY